MLILGVTGSIASYKACDLASRLVQEGVEVHVVMTRRACQFVAPLTFAALTGQSVFTDESVDDDPMGHISLTDRAKLMLVAPATANTLAHLAHGLADNILTSTALAVNSPLWCAPAMNTRMWDHPATRDNCNILSKRQVTLLEPDSGSLACGHTGPGRMMEPEEIAARILKSGLLS